VIVVLERGATESEVRAVLAQLEELGLTGHAIESAEKPLIHVTGGRARRARKLIGMDAVEGLVPTSGPRVRSEGRRFYPYHFLYWSAVLLALLGVLMFMAGYSAPGLGARVDVRTPPDELPIPWYLRAPERVLDAFPADFVWAGWLVLGVIFLFVFLLPVLDRSEDRGLRHRLPAFAVGILFLLAIAVLTFGGTG